VRRALPLRREENSRDSGSPALEEQLIRAERPAGRCEEIEHTAAAPGPVTVATDGALVSIAAGDEVVILLCTGTG
jgi:hypothetical protein